MFTRNATFHLSYFSHLVSGLEWLTRTTLISYLTILIRNYRIDSYAGTLTFVPVNER